MIRHVADDGTGTVVDVEWGTLAVLVDDGGVADVTTVAGVDTRVLSYEVHEPFGCGPALLEFPGIFPYSDLASEHPWLVSGRNVDIVRVEPDGITQHVLWSGMLGPPRVTTGGTTVLCDGDLEGEAGGRMCQPEMLSEERDIGSSIARCLFPDDFARPFPPYRFAFTAATTGITTRKRGSRGQGMLDYVGDLLTLAQGDDGQWTVSRTYDLDDEVQPRSYYLRLKGPIYTNTVRLGSPGIIDDLAPDVAPAVNVIYGEGIDPDTGERWRNGKFPNVNPRTPPDFPTRVSGSGPIAVTDEDADFVEPYSITRMQACLLADGFGGEITGTVDAATITAVNRAQAFYGLAFSSTVDSTTWDAIWSTDGASSIFTSSYFAPLASDPRVEYYLYYADGSIRGLNDTGPNAYDPSIRRVETTINYGECTRAQAVADAQRQIAREADGGGLVGTVTLAQGISPLERHANEIREGSILTLDGWMGSSIDLHIARVLVSPIDHSVTLTVSERAYDLLALSAIIERVRDAKTDPGKSLWARNRHEKVWSNAVGWDGESGAGVIPLSDELTTSVWNKLRMIGPQVGTLQTLEAWCVDPPVRYCVALFGKDLSSGDIDDLTAIIPEPLVEPPAGVESLWDVESYQATLRQLKFINAWGQWTEAAGYFPGRESMDPTPDETGKLKDDASGMAIATVDGMAYTVLVWPDGATHYRQRARAAFAESA